MAQYTTRVGEKLEDHGTTMMFSAFSPDVQYQYLMIWITELPQTDDGRYHIGIQEIEVDTLG